MRTILLLALATLCACTGERAPVRDSDDVPDSGSRGDSSAPDETGDTQAPPDTGDSSSPDDTGDTVAPPECGDGVTEDGEACDDGNTADVDGCLEDCSAVSACGDAVRGSVLDLFPESGAPVQPGAWTFTLDSTYAPGTDWGSLDERSVFQARLAHTGGNDWELRVGRGSQIYSLRTTLGELIPDQRPGDAEWVDEVIQTVLVNTDLDDPSSEPTKYQIHQAGTYRRDPDHDVTFYAPLLEEASDPAEARHATLVWPQQAHVPSNYESRLMLAQQVRDLGAGVLEVTQVIQNFGDENIDYVAAPWLPLRNSAVPVQVASLPGGMGEVVQQGDWCGSCDIPLLAASETDGWFAHLAMEGDCVTTGTCAPTGAEQGIAIVFGLDDRLWYRWGTHPRRDLTVSTAMRVVSIGPKTAWTLRYFLIVGTLDEMRALAPAYRDHAGLEARTLPAVDTPVTPLCAETSALGQARLTADCGDGTAVAHAFRTPTDRSLPLFAMTDLTTGLSVLSVDPYAVAARPHDGSTRYDGLLGWGVLDADDSCYGSALASSVATDPTYFPRSSPDQESVRLRTTAGLACVCP